MQHFSVQSTQKRNYCVWSSLKRFSALTFRPHALTLMVWPWFTFRCSSVLSFCLFRSFSFFIFSSSCCGSFVFVFCSSVAATSRLPIVSDQPKWSQQFEFWLLAGNGWSCPGRLLLFSLVSCHTFSANKCFHCVFGCVTHCVCIAYITLCPCLFAMCVCVCVFIFTIAYLFAEQIRWESVLQAFLFTVDCCPGGRVSPSSSSLSFVFATRMVKCFIRVTHLFTRSFSPSCFICCSTFVECCWSADWFNWRSPLALSISPHAHY